MRTQRGNILFLILLAVVLFAALSYAVTSSMRGGGKDASNESLKSQVATIQNFGLQIRSALMRMTLSGGFQLWQIDYSDGGNASDSIANSTCTVAACKLHDPAGGGIAGSPLSVKLRSEDSTCSSLYSGLYEFRNLSVKGIGLDDQRDLVLTIPGISKAFCLAVNEASNTPNPSGSPPVNPTGSTLKYSGTLSQDVSMTMAPTLGVTSSDIAGKQMFCAQQSNNCFHLFYILAER